MKVIKHLILFIGTISLFLACEQKVLMETVIHPDGSLDRTITLEDADSSQIEHNYFGISSRSGWEVELDSTNSPDDSPAPKKKKRLVIRFTKHFPSYEESNQELGSPADTLFNITSTFEKRFRWFYTYLNYSDTYGAIDRFHYVSQEDFFTEEDYAFIDRLPAEGREISKADELFLKKLNEKIFKDYVARGMFEEQYNMLLTMAEMYKLDQRWLDTLSKYKEPIYEDLRKKEDWDDDILIKLADSLSIPLPAVNDDVQYRSLEKALTAKLDFMSYFTEIAHTTHSIQMPWSVTTTNADSVSGTQLFWRPPLTKFSLRDYRMHAESRKMNYWTVVVSVLIATLAVFLFVKSKDKH